MEFFQTIWTALTTPNEGLFKIMTFPLNFLEAYIGMLFFTTILNIESTRKQKIAYVLLFAIPGFFINILLPNLYATFAIMLLYITLVVVIFKASLLKGFLALISNYAITACLDALVTKTAFLLFNINYEALSTVPLFRVLSISSIYLILWLLTVIIIYFKSEKFLLIVK